MGDGSSNVVVSCLVGDGGRTLSNSTTSLRVKITPLSNPWPLLGWLITYIYNFNSYPNQLIFMLILCEYDACYHTF